MQDASQQLAITEPGARTGILRGFRQFDPVPSDGIGDLTREFRKADRREREHVCPDEVWSPLELGGFLREFRERKHAAPRWFSLETGLHSTERTAASFFDESAYPGFLAVFASRGSGYHQQETHLEKLVGDLEIAAAGRLARMSLGIRMGPMLGLMGTLIPMGPALRGLSWPPLPGRRMSH